MSEINHSVSAKFRFTGATAAISLAVALVSLCLISLTTLALAPVSQSYTIDGSATLGQIVSLSPNYSDQVTLTNVDNASSMLGVIVNGSTSPLTLAVDSGNNKTVQVATEGTEQVLISTINGDIESGDAIASSPINGVGMKAMSNTRVIGTAQGGLNASNGTKQDYTDNDGKTQSVYIGQVPVLVNVHDYYKEPDKTIIPAALQSLADSIAGRQVKPLPIIIAIAIFIIMLIVVTSIVYSMIHSSIISVGRNPMSQSAIYRDIIQLSTLVLAILAVGVISIYMILTRL